MMDVKAAPVAPVRAARKIGGRLSSAAPVLALFLVVAAAWAGSGPPRARPDDPVSSTTPALTDGAPVVVVDRGLAGFPSDVYGLPVLSTSEALAARAAGRLGRQPLAIGGFLRNDALAMSCPAIRLTLSRLFCRRLAAVFPEPAPGSAATGQASAGGTGAPSRGSEAPAAPGRAPAAPSIASVAVIGGLLQPGTPIPVVAGVEGELVQWAAVKVVVVGHYEDERAPACSVARDWCGDDFVVERLVWMEGRWQALETVRDPAIPEVDAPSDGLRAKEIAARSAERGEQILSMAILGARLLAVVDPAAAAGAAAAAAAVAGPGRTGGIWYVRSIGRTSATAAPDVLWAVIDDRTGLVLGYSMPPP